MIRPQATPGSQVRGKPAKTAPAKSKPAKAVHEMTVFRGRPGLGPGSTSGATPGPRPGAQSGRSQKDSGMWISAGGYGIRPAGRTWLWLDPVLFPEEEILCRQYLTQAVRKGARHFVLNAPWQTGLFKHPDRLNLWAGPFCNITNTQAVAQYRAMGFSGAIVSPELDKETFLSLPAAASLPLGVVTRANWPLAVSRIVSPDFSTGKIFFSPKGEGAWTRKVNQTYYTFPTWRLDISGHKEDLRAAGYTLFITMEERTPKGMKMKQRPGMWNWNLKLL